MPETVTIAVKIIFSCVEPLYIYILSQLNIPLLIQKLAHLEIKSSYLEKTKIYAIGLVVGQWVKA